jgi:hypothetical protein
MNRVARLSSVLRLTVTVLAWLALAAIDVLTPAFTYAALAATESRFDPTDVWILLTDLPFMPLAGLFALIMAHVLGQAADLAEDAALTV